MKHLLLLSLLALLAFQPLCPASTATAQPYKRQVVVRPRYTTEQLLSSAPKGRYVLDLNDPANANLFPIGVLIDSTGRAWVLIDTSPMQWQDWDKFMNGSTRYKDCIWIPEPITL